MNLNYKGPWTRRMALVYSQHRHGVGNSYTLYTAFRFEPTNEEDRGDCVYSWLQCYIRRHFFHAVCPSVRLENSHWTDFHEILYLSIFRKSVEKIQDSLEKDKNNG